MSSKTELKKRIEKPTFSKWLRAVMIIMFILYLMLLLYLTLLSGYYGRGRFYRSINLVPFRTISKYINANINKNIIITNLLGNIVAFMPMGFLLPFVSRKLDGPFKVFFTSLGASLLIEAAQYILAVGAADIDDLILNSAGGIIGYFLYFVLFEVYIKLGKLRGIRPEES